MQRIEDIRKLKANSKLIRRDKIESLTPAEPDYLCYISNHSINITFSYYQTSSTIYKNERAD